MLPFGVTTPATVPQRSEIPEGLMNYHVCVCVCIYIYIYIYIELTIEKQRMWNVKNKSDTSNNGGYYNYLTIIEDILEQCTGKARNQVNTANSHIGYRTHTAESTDVKIQKV